jgi:hypothetical protein
LLHLVTVAGDAAVSAAVATAVDRLIAWGRERREANEKAIREAGGEPGPGGAGDLRLVVTRAKHTIRRTFGAEEADLIVDEAELLPGGARVEISDAGRGRSYNVVVSDNGLVTRVRETRR